MRWSYKIAAPFGIRVRVHLSLVVLLALAAALGGGLRGLVLMVAVFGSVLLHELGHALVARARGLPIGDIVLYPFGGLAQLLRPPRTTGEEIGVAAAGPAVSFALGFGFWGLAALSGSPELWMLAEVNLILGAFNLLPALPMDGGRILRALLARRMGFYRATRSAARLARWVAFGLALAGLAWSGWLVVLALMVLWLSLAEEAQARARRNMGDPGYHDASDDASGPSAAPPPRWEVLDPEGPSPVPGRRVFVDRFGNRVIIDWRRL